MDIRSAINRLLEDEYHEPVRSHKFHEPLSYDQGSRFDTQMKELLQSSEYGETEWFVTGIEELENGTFFVSVEDDLGKRRTNFTVKVEWNGPDHPVPVKILNHAELPSHQLKSKLLWSDED